MTAWVAEGTRAFSGNVSGSSGGTGPSLYIRDPDENVVELKGPPDTDPFPGADPT